MRLRLKRKSAEAFKRINVPLKFLLILENEKRSSRMSGVAINDGKRMSHEICESN
jgi:hypothetical protein